MNLGIRRLLQVFLMVSAAAAVSGAQTFEAPNIEYPSLPCELRSEHRVFVHAPLSTRQEIVRELSGRGDLVIAERPEEADYFLLFAYTLVADGSAGAFAADTAGTGARAEMTAVKFVRYGGEKVRPRILFYWQGQKTSRSVPLPLSGMSAAGFTRPRSTRNAVEELIGRLSLWALTKKWPKTFSFDQFSNQLTITTGGKFETSGAKAFLKELKKARGDSYAQRCTPLQSANLFPAGPSPRLDAQGAPAAAPSIRLPFEHTGVKPPAQSRPRGGGARPRSFKRTKKGREDR